ncbi:putative chemoreceptor glutamine deamidase CheD [Gammaproteobacteria bacterium]
MCDAGGHLKYSLPSPPLPFPIRNLAPGELDCDRDPHYVRTVLGSCVAVCLWDRQLHFGGMNHFVLPTRTANDEYSFRFGDVAVPALIERMINFGSSLECLQAKVFGGANILYPRSSIGQRNVELAIDELNRYQIPVVASRLLGTNGLVIRQCTSNGDILVRTIRNSANSLPSYKDTG